MRPVEPDNGDGPRNPIVEDVALAVVSALFAFVVLVIDIGEGEVAAEPAAFALGGLAAAALVFRRHHPVLVLLTVTGARLAASWSIGDGTPLALAAVIALFTVARSGERRTSVAVAVGAALVMGFFVAYFDDTPFLPEFLSEMGVLLLPVAVAEAARSRAERVRDLIDAEAERRVAEERLRIARDLHDVVAHGLSTITVQSGVAAHLLQRHPDQAKEALETINATGKSALEELRVMVGVLRSTDEAPLRPAPTDPDDLSDLVDRAADAGLAIRVTTSGRFPDETSDRCVVAVHRIAQEALTNVVRHAGGAETTLRLDHGDDSVRLEIVNGRGVAAGDAVPSTGVGIMGMAERAEALGGTLDAAPTDDGGFEVIAVIPYRSPTTNGER